MNPSDLRDQVPLSELRRILSYVNTGVACLRAAIVAFDAAGHDTDTSELDDWLEEAVEKQAFLAAAVKL